MDIKTLIRRVEPQGRSRIQSGESAATRTSQELQIDKPYILYLKISDSLTSACSKALR